jgi:hypothetical protein
MPEDVQSLIEGLRSRQGPPAGAKALVRSRLDQTLSLGWGSPSSAPLPRPASSTTAIRLSWSAGRVMLAAAGVVGVGGLLWYAGRPGPRSPESPGSQFRSAAPLLTPATPGVETRAAAPGAVPTQPEPGTAATSTPAVGESQAAAPGAKAVAQPDRSRLVRRAIPGTNLPAPAAGAQAGTPSLAGERRLLDLARNALRDGDANRALAAVGEHARLYPEGQLAEEREVLGIQAMVRSGASAEARARGQAFLSNYPDSPLHRVVQSTVDSIH